jgi:hypothetical protein
VNGKRIVGQMFLFQDGLQLRFAIADLRDACDLGGGVVSVREREYEIHHEASAHAAKILMRENGTVY